MRLRRFLIQASRADQLIKRVSPDLIAAIKKLGPQQINKMFKGFVPLDFVSLVQKENGPAFEQSLRGVISQQLSSEQHKKWIEELGIAKEDAVGEVYISMLNDDPKKRGVLNEILLDGSYSDAFHYAIKDEPKLRLQLRQSLAPSSSTNGIVVPFCPTDKSLGIEKPLWEALVQGNELTIRHGLDKDNRCTQKENLRQATKEEFDGIRTTGEGLTSEQKQLVDEGKRSLEYENGFIILRCTFTTSLPKLQSFLGYKSKQALTDILNPARQKLGRNIPPAKYKRRNELEAKKRSNTLTYEDKAELRSLEEYFNKKQVNYVYTPSSMDTPMGDSEGGEGRTLHETVVVEDADSSYEDAESAKFELSRALGAREIGVLIQIAEKVPLGALVNKFKNIMSLSSKDPKRSSLESEVTADLYKIAQKFFSKPIIKAKCLTCQIELDSTAKQCPYAAQMRGTVLAAYKQSPDVQGFRKLVEQMDEKSLEHYKQSDLDSKINGAYSGVEITEDDLDFDLSNFQSYESSLPKEASKLDDKQLKNILESFNNKTQEAAYLGTALSNAASSEVTEQELERINSLSDYLKKIINDVFTQELEDELATLLLAHGAV